MPRSWRARVAPALAAVVSGALILAACGGGGSKNPSTALNGNASTGSNVATGTAGGTAAAATPAAGGAAASAATPAAAASGAIGAAATPGATGAALSATATPGAPAAGAAATGIKTGGAAAATPAAASNNVVGGSSNTTGATDTGVDSSTIKVGSINMLGMALGNVLIVPQVRGMEAAVGAVNDKGGMYGRRIQFFNCDDGPGDLSLGKACMKKLAEQDHVFAMLTVLSWSSAGIHDDLSHYQMPLVGAWAYSNSEWTDPFMFPTHMSMLHEASNTGYWVRDVIKPKTYGLICLNAPEMQYACGNVRKVLDPTGAKMVKKVDVDVNTADLSSEVLAFRLANPDIIIHYVINPAPMVKFMIDAATQGYYPPKGITGNHLAAEALGSLYGAWPAGRYWTNTTYKLWGADFMATMAKYAPGNHGLNHHIVQAGYVGTNIFADAVKKVGPSLTRKNLMNVLNQGYWYSDPDMGQKFIYNTSNLAPALRGDAMDSGQCTEYMYKYTSSNTVANADSTPNGFIPAEQDFILQDHLDCPGA